MQNNLYNVNHPSPLGRLGGAECPFTEGAVIYKARALFNVINKTFITFADNCPLESSENARISSFLNSNKVQWQISLYPNPTSEEINISSSQNDHLNLEIRDVTGKIVLKKTIYIENNLYQLKIDLKSGIYFVNLMTANGQQFTQKLVITK